MSRTRALTLLGLAAALTLPAAAELRLPAVLGNGMVLPRNQVVPLWGSAQPRMPVSIFASWSPEAKTVLADEKGHWRVDLPTGPAGGPQGFRRTGSGWQTRAPRPGAGAGLARRASQVADRAQALTAEASA